MNRKILMLMSIALNAALLIAFFAYAYYSKFTLYERRSNYSATVNDGSYINPNSKMHESINERLLSLASEMCSGDEYLVACREYRDRKLLPGMQPSHFIISMNVTEGKRTAAWSILDREKTVAQGSTELNPDEYYEIKRRYYRWLSADVAQGVNTDWSLYTLMLFSNIDSFQVKHISFQHNDYNLHDLIFFMGTKAGMGIFLSAGQGFQIIGTNNEVDIHGAVESMGRAE